MRTLGFARIYRTDDGELVMDQDSLRRTDFSGETGYDGPGIVEFGADYDDFEGEDDFEGDDDDDDDYDDDDDSEDDDEFGDAAARRERRAKRKDRRGDRRTKRAKRSYSRADRLRSKNKSGSKGRGEGNMQSTVISGQSNETTAGSVSITILLNHDFNAETVTFDGSTQTAKVNSIICGDDLIFSNAAGVPVSVFASTSQLKNLLEGRRAKLRAGNSIVINGTIASDNDIFHATFIGSKPASRC